jgi:hypothetical protein
MRGTGPAGSLDLMSTTSTSIRLAPPWYRRAVWLLAAIVAALAVPDLVRAAWLAVETATYVPGPREDTSLHGVGYVFAAVLAVPTLAALLLAAVAVGLRGRSPRVAVALATAALVIVVVPALTMAGWLFGLAGV